MRRQFFFGTVFAAAMAVGLGAQSTSQSSYSQSDHGQSVTVTGCLQSADSFRGSSTGTTGTGSSAATTGTETGSTASSAGSMSSASADQFVLTNVSMGASPSTTTGEPPETPTGTTGSINGSALVLSAPSSTPRDWSTYLNHRVEIRGTLEKKESTPPEPSSANPTSTNPTSTNPTSTNPTGTSGSTSGTMTGSSASSSAYGSASQNIPGTMGTLRVSSIKDLGTTCSSK